MSFLEAEIVGIAGCFIAVGLLMMWRAQEHDYTWRGLIRAVAIALVQGGLLYGPVIWIAVNTLLFVSVTL